MPPLKGYLYSPFSTSGFHPIVETRAKALLGIHLFSTQSQIYLLMLHAAIKSTLPLLSLWINEDFHDGLGSLGECKSRDGSPILY
jgi:hypothetical protein